MQLLSFEVSNFGSYKTLALDLQSEAGLTLLHGPTGSGKSTILDIPCWILYGRTAKDGNVDEVRSWTDLDSPTQGTITVELNNGDVIVVVRIRGKATQNDLYWTEAGSDNFNRGKDIMETQKLLNHRLGVDYDTYVISSYFHEFSSSGTFFTSKAKDQRETFEKIVDLSFPAKLANACTASKKTTKQELVANTQVHAELVGRLKQVDDMVKSSKKSMLAWEENQQKLIHDLEVKSLNFDQDKKLREDQVIIKIQRFEESRTNKIADITKIIETIEALAESEDLIDLQIAEISAQHLKCPECDQPLKENNDRLTALKMRKMQNAQRLNELKNYRKNLDLETAKENPYLSQLSQIQESENTYTGQINIEKAKENPFKAQGQQLKSQSTHLQKEIPIVEANIKALEQRVSSLSYLYDLSFSLRGAILQNIIKEIETSVNQTLEEFFDSALRVEFSMPTSDDFQIQIFKNGYQCVYRQLSKGQRQLLKLSFSVSIMKAASQHSGTHFENLFFDESLDGLDNDLKVSAFSLFQQLELDHKSIFLIDHEPQFQTLFDNKYEVFMIGDISEVLKIE